MILQAKIADTYCREMVSLAELPVHNTVLPWLFALYLHILKKKREREKDKDHKFQMSDWIFRYELSLHEGFEGFFSHQRTELLILFLWKRAWQAEGWLCAACPPPPSLSFLVYQPAQEYTGFLTAHGTQTRSWDKSSAFSADSVFPLPMTMWSIRIVFLKDISQIYLGIRNKFFFPLPSTKMLCQSLSISDRGLFAQ